MLFRPAMSLTTGESPTRTSSTSWRCKTRIEWKAKWSFDFGSFLPREKALGLLIIHPKGVLALRYESFTPTSKELSSPIFQSLWVSPSVRHAWHPSRSPLCAIYKGINALYWPSITNYQLLPPHSVLYWPSHTASSSRNAQLSQLDLVFKYVGMS